MIKVTISEKGGQQSQRSFDQSELTIGRMKGNDIVLPKGNVSKRHAQLAEKDGQMHIRDLKSTNGTYVNGRKIEGETVVETRDKVYIGDFILQVEYEDSASSQSARDSDNAASPRETSPENRRQASSSQPRRTTERDPKDTDWETGDAPDVDLDTLDFDTDSTASNKTRGASSSRRRRETTGESESAKRSSSSNRRRSSGARPDEDRSSRAEAEGAPDRRGRFPEKSREISPSIRPPSQRTLSSCRDEKYHRQLYDVADKLVDSEALETASVEVGESLSARAKRDLKHTIKKLVRDSSHESNQRKIRNQLRAECLKLGPIDRYLNDETVEAIYVTGHDRVFLQQKGELVEAPRAFSHPHLFELVVKRLAGVSAFESGYIETHIPDRAVVEIATPLATGSEPALTIRKISDTTSSLSELVSDQVLSAEMATFLTRAVQSARSLLVAGPRGSGKTTLLGALADQIPEDERIISLEKFPELNLDSPTALKLQLDPSRNVGWSELLEMAASMGPDRLLMDDCRQFSIYEWVQSVASGFEGSMATLSSRYGSEALRHLEGLAVQAPHSPRARGIREQISRGVDLLIETTRTREHGFRIARIGEVQGVDLDEYRVSDVFHVESEGTGGRFSATGYVPLFFEDLHEAGWDVDFSIFRD